MDLNLSIKGYVEIRDVNNNIVVEKQNTILSWGKYKLISQLFQTKNENVDGIKYLELFDTPFENKYDLNSYHNMGLVKRIQINRKDNIEVLQYDQTQDDWINFGSVLKQYFIKQKDYRKTYLLEYFSSSPNNLVQYLDIFNLIEQCINNKIKIKFSIPLYRDLSETTTPTFNTMILTYGGKDVQQNNEQNKILINETTNEVMDYTITHRKDKSGIWTSGIPFSVVELPEDVELRDQLFIYWNFIFTFN